MSILPLCFSLSYGPQCIVGATRCPIAHHQHRGIMHTLYSTPSKSTSPRSSDIQHHPAWANQMLPRNPPIVLRLQTHAEPGPHPTRASASCRLERLPQSVEAEDSRQKGSPWLGRSKESGIVVQNSAAAWLGIYSVVTCCAI
ncbi:hypothetical protein BU26DRAFT_137531 [Trematosphaeria pertusa]|uniref:Uncharacterized protein n=1 Tax=Trematosphaeria pertusa TaxID=390896 RepID=A0A6A6IVE5_9PLEO|nr:uncharacterized protein BU26DRAFT_137531 [Trematosphaeria pertusa]KAF2254394.1 hypothetical protein BU26DRAFT_137531 [Trematosphaeria pertusa]